jgi:hypothetical protein
MDLARTIPKLGVLPELIVVHCPSCKGVDTKELISVTSGSPLLEKLWPYRHLYLASTGGRYDH